MKYFTTTKFPFTAQLVDYTTSVDSTGATTRSYFPTGTVVNFSGLGNAQGLRSFDIYAPETLRAYARLDTIRDRSGKLIFPSEASPEIGYSVELTSVAPVLNHFGYVELFRYTATMVLV
jgi:hypothetical protein